MILLKNSATDKLQLVTGAAQNIDVHASFVDHADSGTNPAVSPADRQNTAISTATTTDIVATPAAGKNRNIKTITARNKGTAACDVTVIYDQNGTDFELHKTSLQPGDTLQYIEGIGFFTITAATKLDAKLRVASDVTNNTTSFADITGLTQAVKSGKHYNFDALLFILSAATTTGVQIGVNGPAMTAARFTAIETVTGSATAAALSVPVGDITALDTAIVVQTTGPANVVAAHVYGWINPSADGTFALRVKSEVGTSTVTVKAGSSCRIWESDN